MADLLTVIVDDPDGGGDYTFGIMPGFSHRDLERRYRRDVTPPTLAYVIREWTLRCGIDAATPATSLTALNTFLAGHVNRRLQPAYWKFQDEGSSDLPDLLGILDSTSYAWEELTITGYDFPEGVGQLISGGEFELTLQARKVFPDSAGIYFVERNYEETYSEGGMAEKRLTVEVRISEVEYYTNGGRLTDSDILSAIGVPLSRPVGWHYAPPCDPTTGYVLRTPRYPIETEGVFVSVTRELGGSDTLPPGAGGGGTSETVAYDPQTGLNVKTLRSEVAGTGVPLTHVEADKPQGGLGFTEHDRGANVARGQWETRAQVLGFLAGRVSAGEVQFRLLGGGRPARELPVGNLKPIIRRGHATAWVLVEHTRVFALAPQELADIPVPAAIDSESWVQDEEARAHGLPEIFRPGGASDQHIWVRRITRTYFWDGDGSPLDDATFQQIAMTQFEPQVAQQLRLGL